MVSSCYCAACAVRLQFKILWQGYTQKLEKFTVSPTGTATDYNPSVFHKELKKNYGSVPQSPTASPTDYNRRYFTESWKNIMGVCHNHWRNPRRCYRCILLTDSPTEYPYPEAHACQTRVRRVEVPTDFLTDRKVWRDFWNFLVRLSINCRRDYRRNLMPPTTINVRR